MWVCLQTETSNRNIPLLGVALPHESNHKCDFYHSEPPVNAKANKGEGVSIKRKKQRGKKP